MAERIGAHDEAAHDPALRRFRTALEEAYRDRIERVALFGSHARGDARPSSDYDAAVFLRELDDRWREFDRLAAIETDILYETGVVVHALPFAAGAYRDRTPLMHEVRRDGRDL